MISVLIPWRPVDDRSAIFSWAIARCRLLLPDAEICLGDSGHEVFNRGASLNCAAEEARGDMFVLLDADTFFHREQILDAVAWAEERETWVLPYDIYMNLDQATTDQILAESPVQTVDPAKVGADFRLRSSVSGLIVISQAGYAKVGGFDEHFLGWGYEDRAFEYAANTLLNPCLRMEGYCYHLAHEPTLRFDQPQIEFNRARCEEYRRRAGQPEQMRQLVMST